MARERKESPMRLIFTPGVRPCVFVGPNASQTYEWLAARFSAVRDLHESFIKEREAGVDSWPRISNIADTDVKTLPDAVGPRVYAMQAKLAAGELISVRRKLGN